MIKIEGPLIAIDGNWIPDPTLTPAFRNAERDQVLNDLVLAMREMEIRSSYVNMHGGIVFERRLRQAEKVGDSREMLSEAVERREIERSRGL